MAEQYVDVELVLKCPMERVAVEGIAVLHPDHVVDLSIQTIVVTSVAIGGTTHVIAADIEGVVAGIQKFLIQHLFSFHFGFHYALQLFFTLSFYFYLF